MNIKSYNFIFFKQQKYSPKGCTNLEELAIMSATKLRVKGPSKVIFAFVKGFALEFTFNSPRCWFFHFLDMIKAKKEYLLYHVVEKIQLK
jgi:hypothetical protein